MRRATLLALLMTVGTMITGLRAGQMPAGAPPKLIEVEKLRDNLFVLRGAIGSGPDRVELRYFGRGHTSGDAWVLFPELRTVHAGDIFSGKNLPLLDRNNGGSGLEIGDTLARAAGGLEKSAETIITGHSRQMTIADLREYAQFNREFLAMVREAKAAGRSIDDIAGRWKVPATFAGYAEAQPARLRSNVEVVYGEVR